MQATIEVTINLENYENIKVSITADSLRSAEEELKDYLDTIGRTHEPTRDRVEKYINRVFGKIEKPASPKNDKGVEDHQPESLQSGTQKLLEPNTPPSDVGVKEDTEKPPEATQNGLVCCVCGKTINIGEASSSDMFAGDGRKYCVKHLNEHLGVKTTGKR